MRNTDSGQSAAIVIGGSVAGMVAARVLARYFERVTVIERDTPSRQVDFRRGVPQGKHAHALLLRGQQAMGRFFPDIRNALLQAGATPVNMGREMRWHHFGVWKARYASKLEGLSASRPLIEATLAELLSKVPNVTVLGGWTVNRLGGRDGRITGVAVAPRNGGEETLLSADLVVDATGRGSHTPARLQELGFACPSESSVKVDLGYATRIYRAPEAARDWKSLYVISQPPHKRAGLILPIEGGRWMVTQTGMHGDHPPAEERGFLAFAKSLPVPDLYDAIQSAEPLTDFVRFGYPGGLRHHYEKLRRFPDGLLVLGDALCSFNPVYGQGMSAAAMYAEVLNQVLRECIAEGRHTRTSWRKFFPLAAAVADVPWQLATLEDFRYAETAGVRSRSLRFLQWYTRQAQIAAGHDPLVAERLYEIMNLLRKPSALLAPQIIGRLLRSPRPEIQTPPSGLRLDLHAE